MLNRVIALNSTFESWIRDHPLAAMMILLPFLLLLGTIVENFRFALRWTLAMYVFGFGSSALVEIAAVLLRKPGASRIKAFALPLLTVAFAIALYALGSAKTLVYSAAGIVTMGLLVVVPAVFRHFEKARKV